MEFLLAPSRPSPGLLAFIPLGFILLAGGFSPVNAQEWNGSGPVPSGAESGRVNALRIDPVTGRIYAGTGSGTVFALTDPTLSQAPEAFDDAAVTHPGVAVEINLLANDFDPEGALDTGSVTLQTMPGNGSAMVDANGVLTYTPNGGFIGTDTFTYVVRDLAGNTSGEATVSVRVNAPPSALDDAVSVLQNTPVTIDVLANDADTDGTLDVITVAIQTAPGHGGAQVNADGTVTYTPDMEFSGTDTFTYSVADDDGGVSGPATVTVTVDAAVDPPSPQPNPNPDPNPDPNPQPQSIKSGGGGGASGPLLFALLGFTFLCRGLLGHRENP